MTVNFDDENNILVCQKEYILKLINKFNMKDCKPAHTPVEIKLNLKMGMLTDKNKNKYPYQNASCIYQF